MLTVGATTSMQNTHRQINLSSQGNIHTEGMKFWLHVTLLRHIVRKMAIRKDGQTLVASKEGAL